MMNEIQNNQTTENMNFPYGWNKGDTCALITNKAKKSTYEYIVESYDGKYFGIRSHTPEASGVEQGSGKGPERNGEGNPRQQKTD